MTTTTAVAALASFSLFRFEIHLCCCLLFFSGPPVFLGSRKKEEALIESIDSEFLNDDDDPTLVDDRGRRRSGCPRLDRPVLRHDDALRCRSRNGTSLPRRRRRT
jgi:hypothetical protein